VTPVAPLGHASDEALLSLLEPSSPGAARVRKHLRACALCEERFEELRRMPVLLNETAREELQPARDLAFGAVRRLQRRQMSISHVNEFFGVLFALVRGLTTLLRVEEAPPSDRPLGKGSGDRNG
jgi:hypothetical protein